MISITKKWFIFALCVFVISVVSLDLTAFNLVLASISREMDASGMMLQWIVGGYIIAAASMMAFAGRVFDMVGPRRVLLLGLSVFIIASIGVALSSVDYELVIFRLLQGASVAFLFPVVVAILRLVFSKKHAAFLVACLVAVGSISQAFGPLYGAWMVTHGSWRWIFWINVPISLVCIGIAYASLPRNVNDTKKIAMRIPSVLLLVVGLLALIHGINALVDYGLFSTVILSCYIVAIVSLVLFVHIEKKSAYPVLDVRLFQSLDFNSACLIRFVLMFAYFSLLYVLGLMLQNVLHYSAFTSIYYLIQMTVVLGLIAIFSGKLVDKVGIKKPLLASLILLFLGVSGLMGFSFDESRMIFTLSLIVLGVGFAVSIPSSVSAVVLVVRQEKVGAATGVMYTLSFIGASLGVTISGCVIRFISKGYVQEMLAKTHLTFTAAQERMLYLVASGARSLKLNKAMFDPSTLSQVHELTKAAYIHSYELMMCILMVLALVSCYCGARLRLSSSKAIQQNKTQH